MRKRTNRYKLYNPDTKELSSFTLRVEQDRIGGKWMRLFQEEAIALTEKNLHGESYRVLFRLMGLADYNNNVPDTRKIAELLNIKRSNVCRAYRELLDSEILIEKGGGYYLTPRLAWKGNEQQLEAAYKELYAVKVKALPPKELKEVVR